MEILMKLKCSPTNSRSSTNSLKNIERLQQQYQPQKKLQLQQKTQQEEQSKQQHQQSISALDFGISTQITSNLDCCNPHGNYINVHARCCESSVYSSPPLQTCCGVRRVDEGVGGVPSLRPLTYTNPPNSYILPNYNLVDNEVMNEDCDTSYEYQEPEENFVSIDDAKIKGFLMKIGEEQRLKKEEEKLREQKLKSLIGKERFVERNRRRKTTPKVVYEIIDLDDEEEREKLKRIKNQAEFDCNKKAQQEEQLQKHHELEQNQKLQITKSIELKPQHQKNLTPTRQSPNISLVPAAASKNIICPGTEKKKEEAKYLCKRSQCRKDILNSKDDPLLIIAQIEILDSSDEETDSKIPEEERGLDYDETVEREEKNNIILQVMSDDEGNDALVPTQLDQENNLNVNELLSLDKVSVIEEPKEERCEEDDDDYGDLPLAASAVSCELECDDDNDDDKDVVKFFLKNNVNLKITETKIMKRQNINKDNKKIVILASDEENEYIDEHEEGLELRWEELELGTRETRNNFECFVCGKKVQSNYNLRRHMMIHTGERPFGCDLCERRFREFSDLKKHRRRHASEPSFVCMVCRLNPPTDCDPTRCNNCDSKMGAMIAMRSKPARSGCEDIGRNRVTPTAKVLTSSVLLPQKKTSLPPLPSLTKGTVTTEAAATTAILSTLKVVPADSSKRLFTPTKMTEKIFQKLPPLTPISLPAEDQLVLLDHIPPVFRSTYIKGVGMATRKEFPCPLCQRPFGTRHNLKRHFMIHTGEKPFSCGRCRKPFREYSTLKKHMITHARDRWYKCLRCPQKYLDYLEYMSHKGAHTEDNNGSGAEDTSGSSSNSTQSSPKKRSRQMFKENSLHDSQEDDDSSTADDWLECCECGQRFTEFEVYTEHLKSHDVHALVYECYVCKQTLKNMRAFEQHMRQEHGTSIDSDDDNDNITENNDGHEDHNEPN